MEELQKLEELNNLLTSALSEYKKRGQDYAKDKIKSTSFTKEQLDLMNLGVAVYKSFDKLFNDGSEEADI